MMKSLQHQVAYVLSLNIIIQDNDSVTLKQFPLVQLTRVLLAIWTLKRWVSSVNYQLHMLKMQVKHSVTVTCKLVQIGFTSLAWGVI